MSNVFSGGIPYALDVNRLKAAFPVASLNEGVVISHVQLEATIDTPKGTGRYYGVINSWRAEMKNSNAILMEWDPSVGLKVLDPAAILGHAEKRTRQKIGQTVKAIKIFAWVPRSRLDAIGQQRLDHDVRITNRISESLKRDKKEMAIELAPVKSLPKPKLIREAS
jgi:hypothetical protein